MVPRWIVSETGFVAAAGAGAGVGVAGGAVTGVTGAMAVNSEKQAEQLASQ